jgi:hypothetical protein
MKKAAMILAGLALVSTIAVFRTRAQTQMENTFATGNDLLEACENETNTFQSARCRGFVEGAVGGYELATNDSSVLAPTDLRLCIPQGVTHGQELDVVLKFLRAHPEMRHKSPAALTVLANLDAWACKIDPPRGPR